MKSIIVIPVYTDTPSRLDNLSLSSLNNMADFNEYDICLICPNDLDISSWKELLNHDCIVKNFSSDNFLSTITYSKMLESNSFWKEFESYEYVLIFQTDGYCIEGTLSNYMKYDYIGGPIVSQNARWFNVPAIGNGGVSLRKVSTMLEVTSDEFRNEFKEDIEKHNRMNGNMYSIYEDLYFAQLVPMLWDFTKPDFLTAASFAYDMNSDIVYELTSHKLPMFIHGFDKNIRFWRTVLPEFKDINIVSDCEWKNRKSWFSPSVNYQGNLPHDYMAVGAIVCVKNGNHLIDKLLSNLEENGFKKTIIIDNNDLGHDSVKSGIAKKHTIDVEFIDKFIGQRCTKDYDLMSEMYSYAYLHYCSDLTHVMFIDIDEQVHLENKEYSTITNVVSVMNKKGYEMMHVPCIDLDCNSNPEHKTNRKKVKTLLKTGLNIKKFFRETPVVEVKCCDNSFEEASSLDRTYKDDKSLANIYITNDCTGTLEEFNKYKLFRGWPDRLYDNRKNECNEDYYYMFNDKKSTITLE